MINVPVFDLWETNIPRIYTNVGACPKYIHRLMWCSIPHIKQQPFYAKNLVNTIWELYNERVSVFTVAAYLHKLENVGYIERIHDGAKYQYRTTQLYRNHWKEAVG